MHKIHKIIWENNKTHRIYTRMNKQSTLRYSQKSFMGAQDSGFTRQKNYTKTT